MFHLHLPLQLSVCRPQHYHQGAAVQGEICFDFGEVNLLPVLLLPESVCYISNSLAPPNLPLQIFFETFLFFVGFCNTLPSALQFIHSLLSVAWIHLRTAGSHLLRLRPQSAPLPLDPSSTPTLLPPLSSAVTTGHSASLGSLGTSAPPVSDIATPPLQTCRPSAALWPSTPSAAARSALPHAPTPPSVTPAPPLGVVTAAPSQSPRPLGFTSSTLQLRGRLHPLSSSPPVFNF